MSALKDALRPTTTSKSNTSKTPTFYSREKGLFITDMASNADPIVRIAAAGNDHIPAGTLKQRLENESDTDVLRTILMNPRTPLKAIAAFSKDDRAEDFADDEEVSEYLKTRVSVIASTNEDDLE